jgi:hypothetical protein
MLRKLLFIYISSSSCLLFSQDTNAVKQYLHHINNAELAIVDSQYQKALSAYEAAFRLGAYIHTADLSNAAILYIASGDFENATSMMDSLVMRGYPLDFFLKKSTYEQYRASPYWVKFIGEYPTKSAAFYRGIDWESRAFVEYAHVFDQNMYQNKHRFTTDTIERRIIEHVVRLCAYFDKNGYPTDKKIGCFFLSDTAMLSGTWPFNVVIRHAYQCGDFSLSERLLTFVKQGLIKPEQYVNWRQIELVAKQVPGRYGLEHFWAINKTVFRQTLGVGEKEHIESNRRNAWGCSYDDFYKKATFVLFESKGATFNLGIWNAIACLNVAPEEVSVFSFGFEKTQYRYGTDN